MNIKELRLSTRMTQQEFGEYFGIPKRTIENWESGHRNPPSYVVELIKYKIKKEGLEMIKDLGGLKLYDTEDYDTFYVTVQDTFIFATQQYPNYPTDIIGKIKVYHSGTYAGTVEDMEGWLQRSVIDHVIDKAYVIKDGETMAGDIIWKWSI